MSFPGELTFPEELTSPVDPSLVDQPPLALTQSTIEFVLDIFPANIAEARARHIEHWLQTQAQQRPQLPASRVPSLSYSLTSREYSSDEEENADDNSIDTSPPVPESPQPTRTPTPVGREGDDSDNDDPAARDLAITELRDYLVSLVNDEREDLMRLMAEEEEHDTTLPLPDAAADLEPRPQEPPPLKKFFLYSSPALLPHDNPVTCDLDAAAAAAGLEELAEYGSEGVRAIHAQGRWPGSTNLEKQMLRMRLMLLMGARGRAPA